MFRIYKFTSKNKKEEWINLKLSVSCVSLQKNTRIFQNKCSESYCLIFCFDGKHTDIINVSLSDLHTQLEMDYSFCHLCVIVSVKGDWHQPNVYKINEKRLLVLSWERYICFACRTFRWLAAPHSFISLDNLGSFRPGEPAQVI